MRNMNSIVNEYYEVFVSTRGLFAKSPIFFAMFHESLDQVLRLVLGAAQRLQCKLLAPFKYIQALNLLPYGIFKGSDPPLDGAQCRDPPPNGRGARVWI